MKIDTFYCIVDVCLYIVGMFSLFQVPVCKVIRFNIEYTIHWFEETPPEVKLSYLL